MEKIPFSQPQDQSIRAVLAINSNAPGETSKGSHGIDCNKLYCTGRVQQVGYTFQFPAPRQPDLGSLEETFYPF